MLMPTKHINFSQSLLGFGSYLLDNLNRPKTIDDLWNQYLIDKERDKFSANHSFDNLILALIFLYGINAIKEENGLIYKCD